MYEFPIIWRFKGDKHAGQRFRRLGMYMMAMLERGMSFQRLEQWVLRRWVTPDVHIECVCCFGIRTVTITVAPGAGEAVRLLRDCFANSTVALAYVLDVAGVEAVPQSQQTAQCVTEPVCRTCIAPESYPEDYYCTKGIRYTVAVCDGEGEYVLYGLTKAASTDYTPRCPGEQVLVMQHRTTNLPEAVLNAANANPYAKRYFTRPLASFPDECLSILPFPVSMPRVNETEER